MSVRLWNHKTQFRGAPCLMTKKNMFPSESDSSGSRWEWPEGEQFTNTKNTPEIPGVPHHLPNKLLMGRYEFVAGSKLSRPCGFY